MNLKDKKIIAISLGIKDSDCFSIRCLSFTSGAGTAYPSGAHEFTPGSSWGSCYSSFRFICMFSRSLFVLLYFLIWPL